MHIARRKASVHFFLAGRRLMKVALGIAGDSGGIKNSNGMPLVRGIRRATVSLTTNALFEVFHSALII